MSSPRFPLRVAFAVTAVAGLVGMGVGGGGGPGAGQGADPRSGGAGETGTIAPLNQETDEAGFFAAPLPISGEALGALETLRSGEPGTGPTPQQAWDPRQHYDFYFTRAVYGGGGMRSGFFGRGSWAVDYPKADRQFLVVLGETLDLLDVPDRENAVRLEDPNLRRFPFLYTLEVGGMYLTPAQVEGLRGYLRAGGFLVVDDFWGAWEWRNFEAQMRRVFPGLEIVDMPLDHEIFHVFYDIEEILQVPNVNNAARGVTSECGPCRPAVRGIFDEKGRLMVIINWNTDLGDAWEWSEQPHYPFRYSNYAYKMAVNFIVYAMTH